MTRLQSPNPHHGYWRCTPWGFLGLLDFNKIQYQDLDIAGRSLFADSLPSQNVVLFTQSATDGVAQLICINPCLSARHQELLERILEYKHITY